MKHPYSYTNLPENLLPLLEFRDLHRLRANYYNFKLILFGDELLRKMYNERFEGDIKLNLDRMKKHFKLKYGLTFRWLVRFIERYERDERRKLL